MDKQWEASILVDEPNKRIKVLQYQSVDIAAIDQHIEQRAGEIGVTKLIIYARKRDVSEFMNLGYRLEGTIDGFFNGINAQMVSRFLTDERSTSQAPEAEDEIVRISLSKQETGVEKLPPLPDQYIIREASVEDAEEMAFLYGLVFKTYPTPMNDPSYVKKTMQESTFYSVVEANGRIVCAASAEVTPEYGSAEITDCVTHPDYLGNGLLQYLFPVLEQKMDAMNIFYLYTLTRAQSHGMNITAAKQGYQYRGRLVNNCTIFSGYEDMNIWVKPLRETSDE
ncbi:putative beta-lysine N-acetyltransferase [Brevibacillus sp. SYSU BS000544]|uniref:putative beta-lysine N-acetyltransferase n=1 Tax=Brevibacillus sp. SYSU BS000544 TaxID=3416443 RepID=UPI003CE5B45C